MTNIPSINRLVSLIILALLLGGGLYFFVKKGDESEASEIKKEVVRSPQNAEAPLPEIMEDTRLVASSEQLGYKARKKALSQLSHKLPDQDFLALMDFVSGEKPEDCTLRQWHALVNDVLNTLRHQSVPSQGLTPRLVGIYRTSNDVVMRDYALQHLRGWYADRDTSSRHEVEPENQKLILKTLLHAASETEQAYSGTALIALHHISRQGALQKEPDTKVQIESYLAGLDDLILEAAKSVNTNRNCRISAIQLCARRNLTEILPLVRELALDTKANTSIRISAIAALGQLGKSEDDARILQQLQSPEGRLSIAAFPALKKLLAKTPDLPLQRK